MKLSRFVRCVGPSILLIGCLLLCQCNAREDDYVPLRAGATVKINEIKSTSLTEGVKVDIEMFTTELLTKNDIITVEVQIGNLYLKRDVPGTAVLQGKYSVITLTDSPLPLHHFTGKYGFTIDFAEVSVNGRPSDSTPSFNVRVNETIARFPNGDGEYAVFPPASSTLGSANPDPGLAKKVSSFTHFSPRDSAPNAILEYQGALWIFGGWDENPDGTFSDKANIWRSEDGTNWTLINETPPFVHHSQYIAFKERIFIYTDSQTLYITKDGIAFDRKTLKQKFNFSEGKVMQFKNKLWIFDLGTVAYSSDGIDWTNVPSAIPGPIRNNAAICVLNDKLYYFGGYLEPYTNPDNYYNDVYRSDDGLKWEKISEGTPWAPRIWFNAISYQGKIWLFNGWSPHGPEYGNYSEAWTTDDGVTWSRHEIAMPARHASFCVIFKNKLLLMAGFGSLNASYMYNDVWQINSE